MQKGQKRYLNGSSWTGVKSNWEPTGGAWPLKQSAPPDWGSWVTLITPTGITWAKNGGLISYFVQRRLRLPQLHVLQITDWITDQNTIFELRSYLYWYIEKSNLVWGQHQNGSKRADDDKGIAGLDAPKISQRGAWVVLRKVQDPPQVTIYPQKVTIYPKNLLKKWKHL